MKQALTSFFILISITLSAQTFSGYLEVGNPSSLEDLAKEVIKPEYKLEIKEGSYILNEYVEKAQEWLNYSDSDLEAWKASVVYLMDMGFPLSENVKGKSDPIFYLTCPNYTELSWDADENQYLLHTSLFELGAKSDYNMDGTYFKWVLENEPSDSPILQAYFDDFKAWEQKRQTNWLLDFFGQGDGGDMITAVKLMIEKELFDVNLRSKNGKKNLFDAAVVGGNTETAMMLLDEGFDVNKRCFDCNGETALHRVVEAEIWGEDVTYELVLKMLAAGGDPDLRDMNTLTPIHLAIKLQNEQAFTALMQEEVKFTVNLVTDKGLNYVQYFEKHWSDDREDDFLIMLMEKTELKPTPNKEESKQMKADEKTKKSDAKDAKKEKKKSAKEKKKGKD